MIACNPAFAPRLGLGTPDQIYYQIAQQASSGSNTLGTISTMLLNLGFSVEAARQALNTVAQNVGSDPQQLAALNAELNYLNTYGGTRPQGNQWVLPTLIAVGLLAWYLASERK